jgi:hypothetical protein
MPRARSMVTPRETVIETGVGRSALVDEENLA